MIRHHPDEALLLAHAGASLEAGPAILVESHLESCRRCRQVVRDFERLGGGLLDDEAQVELAAGALENVLSRLERPIEVPAPPVVRPKPSLPDGVNWPRALRHCHVSRWRPMGPGMRWSRVGVPHDPAANVLLLWIGAGKCLPQHTHTGTELTQVLHGSFDDGRAVFSPGDFDEADTEVRHQPVVQAQGECICLAAVDGRLVFDSWIARLASSVVGL